MKVIKIESISTQQIHMLWLLAHSLKCVDALWNCVTNYKKDEFNILMNMTRSDTQCPVYDGKTIYELYENYMTKFRSRTPGELKLETLNIHDDFKQFADLLIGYSQMEHPPTNKMDKSEKLSWVDKIYSYFFGWHATNRENLRLLRSQLFDVIRIIFMKMGDALAKQGIIEASRDILYLTYDEVMKFDDNTTEYFKRVVTERKAMYEQYNKCEIAQTFVSINGHIPVSYNNSDVNTDDIPAFVTGSVVNSGDSLTGEIVIVTDPSQVNVNMRGKILVAKNTDPGYTPLLHLASAILVQEGGDLSHASIVAREIGALCVYGIPNLVDYVIKGNIKTVTIKGNTVIFHK
jgi:pyruvate,water dikinase